MDALHIVPGDSLAAEVAPVLRRSVEAVVPWRDLLHDGPVPAGLNPDQLARVRASHLARCGWPQFRTGYRDVQAAWRRRRRYEPSVEAFAALRSPDPRAWAGLPAFARLLAELPDVQTGLSVLERGVLDVLRSGVLAGDELFARVSMQERPPWIADQPLFAVARDLAPLVSRSPDGRYALTPAGADVLAGRAVRPRADRWLGGVHLGPGQPDWRYDPLSKRAVLRQT